MYQGKPRHPIVRALGSLKLTLIILAVFAVAIGVATFIEQDYGTDGARALVYNAKWFEALLAFLILNLIVSLFANMPYRRFQTGFVITHIAFILVLLSSAVTRYLGYEGTMHIREGSATGHMMSALDHVRLAEGEESAEFPVRLYRAGRTGIAHDMTLGTETYNLRIEEYWSHFEMQIAEGTSGRPVVNYVTGAESGSLEAGDSVVIGGVMTHFMGLGTPPDSGLAGNTTGTSEFGELDVIIGNDRGRFAVTASVPTAFELGGYSITITEFAPNFRVGEKSSADAPMRNPAIRVQVKAPDGKSEERLLFAFHPDFNMGARDEALAHISLRYSYSRNLYLYLDNSGLLAAADFTMDAARGGSEPAKIELGEWTSVESGTELRSGDFSMVITQYWRSAVEVPAMSGDPNRPPAIRVSVTDASGNRADAVVPKWSDDSTVRLGGRELQVSYGPIRIDLPYRLFLDSFVLQTYPGSENPASFESHVRIYDEERGIDGEPYHIYMNHPLTYRNFKHFQSSYDQDRKGTILSVNHDPGKWPTYIGYFFVGLGFLITLTRGLLWHRRPNI